MVLLLGNFMLHSNISLDLSASNINQNLTFCNIAKNTSRQDCLIEKRDSDIVVRQLLVARLPLVA